MSKIKLINESKHTKNNYKKLLKNMNHQEILSEYNKLSLILNMMKNKVHGKPFTKGQDNIRIIKYKYNLICQEITQRQYHIMNDNYRPKNATIRYSR